MDEVRTAQRLDPLSLAINTDVGFHNYYNGRYADAIAQLHSVIGMKRDFGLAQLWLARSYLEVAASTSRWPRPRAPKRPRRNGRTRRRARLHAGRDGPHRRSARCVTKWSGYRHGVSLPPSYFPAQKSVAVFE
jgi:hypothetical protein